MSSQPESLSLSDFDNKKFVKKRNRSPWLFVIGLVAVASAVGIFLPRDQIDYFEIERYDDPRRLSDLDPSGDSRIKQCQVIDPTKMQIILLNMGTVRSFLDKLVHEQYYRNEVRSIEIRSNVQIHQLWYFASDDDEINSETVQPKTESGYPQADLERLRELQNRYGAPVMEFYPAAVPFPPYTDSNPYQRNCSSVTHHSMFGTSPKSGYAQNYHLQNAFQLVQEYVEKCDVNYEYLIRTRPDLVCSTPAPFHFLTYKNEHKHGKKHFIHDNSWNWPVADYLWAVNRRAAEQLFLGGRHHIHTFMDNFYNLPCEATPQGEIHNAEFFFGAVLKGHDLRLIPENFNMCGFGRPDTVCRGKLCWDYDTHVGYGKTWPVKKSLMRIYDLWYHNGMDRLQ